MATLSELIVELKLSAESFNNGLKQAQREAREFEKDIKPTLEATKNLGVAMAAAGGAIVAGMGAATKAAVDYGDALNDARQRTGASVETLSKLGFAAEQSGSSFEGLSNGVKFLSKNMEAAISKSGEQRSAFNALGISSKELAAANGDVEKVLLLIADKFQELPDDTNQAALAMKVFGKSGADLIPLLNEGSAGIKKLGDDAQRAGLVIGQDFASASDQLNDTLNEVKASAMGVSVGIAQALLPAIQTVASFAAEAGAQFAAFSKEHPVLIQVGAALGVTLVTIGTGLTAVAVIVPKVVAGFQLLSVALAGPAGVVLAIGAAVAAIAGIVYAYKQWSDASKNLAQQLKDETTSRDRAIDALKKYKIEVDLAGKNEDQQAQAIAKAGKELQAKLLATKQATEATKPHVDAIVDEVAAEKAHKEALERAKDAADLASKGLRIMLDMRVQDADLLPRITKLQFDYNDSLREGGEAAIAAAAELGSFNEIVSEAVKAMEQARYNAEEMDKDFDSLMKKDPGVHIGKGFDISAEAIKKNTEEAKKLEQATADIKNSAGKIFDDMFIKGESVFSSLGNALKGGALSLGRAIFEDVTAALLGPIKKAFDDFFQGLLEGTGLKALISGLGRSLGGALSGVFGGGGAGAAASAAGGASSAVGSVGSSIGSAASGVLGGVIGGGISALGSFLSTMRLEGTMNAVEYNTRATAIEIADMMELILQPQLARTEDILDELFNHKYLPDIITTIGNETIATIANGSNAIVAAISGIRLVVNIPPPPAVKAPEAPSTPSGAPAGSGAAPGTMDQVGGMFTGTPNTNSPGYSSPFGGGPYTSPFGGGPSGMDYVPRYNLPMSGSRDVSAPRPGGDIFNITQNQGEDGEVLARRVVEILNRDVEEGGHRLISSGVRR